MITNSRVPALTKRMHKTAKTHAANIKPSAPSFGQPPALPWHKVFFFTWKGPMIILQDGKKLGNVAATFVLDKKNPDRVKRAVKTLKSEKQSGELYERLHRKKLDMLLINASSPVSAYTTIPAMQQWDEDKKKGLWYQSVRSYYVHGVSCPGPYNAELNAHEESSFWAFDNGQKSASVWVTDDGKDFVEIYYDAVFGGLRNPFKDRLTFKFAGPSPYKPPGYSNIYIEYFSRTGDIGRLYHVKDKGGIEYLPPAETEKALEHFNDTKLLFQKANDPLAAPSDTSVTETANNTMPEVQKQLAGITTAVVQRRAKPPTPFDK